MEELVKIHYHNGESIVSARDLHECLESKQEFSPWIKKRIAKFGFIENQDYTSFDKIIKRESGASTRKEYGITLDMAKELSMVENNEQGKKARRYFIETEKKARQLAQSNVPKTYHETLQLAANLAKENAEKDAKLAIQAPKVSFADRVIDLGEDTTVDVGQTAKLLKLPFGRNILFSKLREEGIFFKNRNEPKQQYINQGYFELRQKLIQRDSHKSFVVTKILVTQKGLYWLSKKYGGNLNK